MISPGALWGGSIPLVISAGGPCIKDRTNLSQAQLLDVQ